MRNYSHGGDIYNKKFNIKYDFSANINPLGMPQKSKEAIIEHIDSFAIYPDPFCRQLTNKVAEVENIDDDFIICGNGAADLLYRFAQVIKPKDILVLAPTFSEYEASCNSYETRIHRYYLNDFQVDRNILEFINEVENLDIIYLCSPNNPTGKVIDRELIIDICKLAKNKDCFVLVDHCFLLFLEDSEDNDISNEVYNFENLVVLKAFTKIYAMAGLRLGYMISSNIKLIDNIFSTSQPWSVSSPAQVAGIFALESKGFIEKTVKYIANERLRLFKALKREGFKVIESYANYICFEVKDGKLFRDKFLEKGVLIRDCSNYHGLNENFCRIAVRTMVENDYFIKVLEELKWQKR